MKSDTMIPVHNLVSNVTYTLPDADYPETLIWKKVGEVNEMTLEQIKTMFALHPEYKNWLMPSDNAVKQLSLEDHYEISQRKAQMENKNRINFGRNNPCSNEKNCGGAVGFSDVVS